MFRRTPLALIATAAAFSCSPRPHPPRAAARSSSRTRSRPRSTPQSRRHDLRAARHLRGVSRRRRGRPHDRGPARRRDRCDGLPARAHRWHGKHHDRSRSGLPVCPPTTIEGFKLKGLTIQNADFTGVFLIGVTNFHVTGGKYIANAEYGIFPRCSSHGLIDWNLVDGAEIAEDAGIYVGVDEDIDVQTTSSRARRSGSRWRTRSTRACAGTSPRTTPRPCSW